MSPGARTGLGLAKQLCNRQLKNLSVITSPSAQLPLPASFPLHSLNSLPVKAAPVAIEMGLELCH